MHSSTLLPGEGQPSATYSLDSIRSACGHHNFADALFHQGFQLLVADGLTDKRVLEVCCGHGALANWLAEQGAAEVVAIDSAAEAIAAARGAYSKTRGLSFRCGDVLDLSEFPDDSFDIVLGQATLHHLTNNLPKASSEFHRVLRPGGRCIFIFEPLGHNPVIAAIRAAINSKKQYLDESMLFESALEQFGQGFDRYQYYPFGLLAYVCKALPKHSSVSRRVYQACNLVDQKLFKSVPASRLLAANCNVCYWKPRTSDR